MKSSSPIIHGVVLGAFDRTGQEAMTERRERDETNSELFEGRDHVVLEVALSQGILADWGSSDRSIHGTPWSASADAPKIRLLVA